MLQAPQQARAIATRAKLVEAAAALLVDEGLRGTTTAAVAARASVSQGALFKHFPTKLDLLAAVTESLLASLVREFRSALPKRMPGDVDARMRLGVSALWRVFRLPAMQALFEIYLAARTDADLGQTLEPLLVAHRENIHREARALLPELAEHPGLTAGVDAVVYAMQGVVLGFFSSDERREREHLAFFERLATNELAAAAVAASTDGARTDAPRTSTTRTSTTRSNGSRSNGARANAARTPGARVPTKTTERAPRGRPGG